MDLTSSEMDWFFLILEGENERFLAEKDYGNY